ncbi:MAG: glycosyltransferase [Chloroflexi bacterium]|nr:glycosyltransferase [Chloroflexota bacterium]
MNDLRVAHVVRDHGGLTEPFIHHRLLASAGLPAAELWTERTSGGSPLPVRQVDLPRMAPGSLTDRAFHRVPVIGPPLAAGYRNAEVAFAPSVIHAHYATTGYLIGETTHTPLVVNTYGFDVTILSRRRLWRRAYRRLADRAAAIIVEGPTMADSARALGFRSDRVVIIPIAAGLGSIEFRATVPVAPLRLLACGRFVEKKGHDQAIMAFARLAPELPADSELVIIGDGPLRPDLERLALAQSSAGCIRFTGAVPRPAFLDELRRSHLFLAPSRTARNGDGEGGAPTTILDAQAVGVPVVASTHADIPYLVADGTTGFLAREGDVASLVHTIRRALEARPQWLGLTQVARRATLDRNGDDTVRRQLLDLYARVLATQRTSR